ncbi:MAG: hypothetical protein HW392_2195 [Steroidobacteraceae bacterium]|nr:hypothetical protein [Steroidobacteraceae bacterium]
MEVEVVAVLIPLFGIVFGIAVAIVAIIAAHREKTQRVELRHKERLAAMEKGLELPPELEDPDNSGKRSRTGSLRSGLIGLGVGIVLYFALDRLAGDDVALLGLIPAAVGLANLIFYYVEGRKKSNGNGGALR